MATTNLDNCRLVGEPDVAFPAAEGGQQFVDDWSCNGSIGRPEGYDGEGVKSWKAMDSAVLFDGIDAHDIHQGTIGDCYFLASCASVAKNPAQIKKLFLNDGKIQNGAIGMRLFFNGKPTVVWVDDRFACDCAGVPVFARPSKGSVTEVWMMALEKAYGKLHGKYENMGRGGFPHVALNDLTGLPTTSLPLQSHHTSLDMLWKELESSKNDKKIISAGIFSSPFRRFLSCRLSRPINQLLSFLSQRCWACCMSNCATALLVQIVYLAYHYISQAVVCLLKLCQVYQFLCRVDAALSLYWVGIVGGHAYSVTNTCAVGCTRLVQVRNPWGNASEWKGWFSDGSLCWTARPGLAAATKHAQAQSDDGSWWMSLGDFAQYFDRIDVLHSEESFCLRCEGTARANDTCVVFNVSAACNVRVQVHQARRVCMDQHGLGSIDWRLSVCKAESLDTPLVTADDVTRYCCQGLPKMDNLPPGRYAVRIDHQGLGGDLPVDLTLAFYSSVKDAVSVDGCGSASNQV